MCVWRVTTDVVEGTIDARWSWCVCCVCGVGSSMEKGRSSSSSMSTSKCPSKENPANEKWERSVNIDEEAQEDYLLLPLERIDFSVW